MTALLLALVLHQSAPEEPTPPPLPMPAPERAPLISAPNPTPPPPPERGPRPLRTYPLLPREKLAADLPPARFALFFSPFALFGAALWVEGDLHLDGGFTVFLNVGGGPFGQLAGDVGFRHFLNREPWQGFYADFRGSIFTLPAGGLVLAGPGVQLGHAWRISRIALTIGLGFTTWFTVSRQRPGAKFLNSFTSDAEVVVFPGFTQPPTDPGLAVNPTVHFSFGPTF